MKRRLLRTKAADQDLDDIWAYIAFANPSSADPLAADLVLDAIQKTFTTLTEFPHRKKVLESGVYLSQVEGFSQYLVLYEFDEQALEVLRVFRSDLDWMRLI